MAEKCFCHLNGFAVKDSTARQEIEQLKKTGGVDETAREAATNAQNAVNDLQTELNAHKQSEVVDVTARAAILSLEQKACVDSTARASILALEQKEVVDETARTDNTNQQTQINALDSRTTDHANRLTALEGATGGSGLTWTKMTLSEFKTFLAGDDIAYFGKLVKFVHKTSDLRYPIDNAVFILGNKGIWLQKQIHEISSDGLEIYVYDFGSSNIYRHRWNITAEGTFTNTSIGTIKLTDSNCEFYVEN